MEIAFETKNKKKRNPASRMQAQGMAKSPKTRSRRSKQHLRNRERNFSKTPAQGVVNSSRRAAETASSKPLKAKQNHGKPWQDSSLCGACMRNRETPAGFKRKGWSIRPQTGCRDSLFETVKSKAIPWQDSIPKRKPIPLQRARWGMHAKQGNPSRIQAQGVFNSSPDGLPKQHLRNR